MIEMHFYFDDKQKLNSSFDLLKNLSHEIKPVYFSGEEKIKSKKDNFENKERFDEFIKNNPIGYFLFNEKQDIVFNYILRDNDFSKIDIYFNSALNNSLAIEVFEFFTVFKPVFGFAAEENERDHRNRIHTTLGVNKIESWVGRDLHKYLPGLYWLTVISKDLIKERDIDIFKLKSKAIFTKELENNSVLLFQFFDQPNQWQENIDKLDDLCESVEGIFSIKNVTAQLSTATNFLELNSITSKWK